jgi:tetratricopeptide (TPR) repeat protein
LHNNLAAIYGRMGQDERSLAMLDMAREAYHQVGEEGESHLSHTELNRSIVLRDLGRYKEAIAASNVALLIAERFRQDAMVARIRQNKGITYFVQGRYNEALQLLHQARDTFAADGRLRDAILVELFLSDCLLQLRRFPEVLEKSRRSRELFSERGTQFEVAQSWLNEAMAHLGLGQFVEAQAALDEAHALFQAEGNASWMALTTLKRATFFLQQKAYDRAYETAQLCARHLETHNLPLAAAQAQLVAGQAAAALGRIGEARCLAEQVRSFGERADNPFLTYQGHLLLGQLAQLEGELGLALAGYDAAIRELERLQGRLMVEYRSAFVADKQTAYEDALLICLELAQPQGALEYAERARSRALLDLLAHRLNLGLQARSTADSPLVEQLLALRAERDRLYRRWESGEERPAGSDLLVESGRVQEDVLSIEKKITTLWHELLVRNADYARDAALWQVQTEPAQPFLDKNTTLVSYFFARDQLVVFLVSAGAIRPYALAVTTAEVSGWLQRFGLNLRAVPHSREGQQEALLKNAQLVLHKLYNLLL